MVFPFGKIIIEQSPWPTSKKVIWGLAIKNLELILINKIIKNKIMYFLLILIAKIRKR